MTEFKTEDQKKAYIYLVQDNYSRTILGYQLSLERKASYTFENLSKVNEQYLVPANIKECMLLTDDGLENYGEVKKWIEVSDNPKINHVIGQVDIHFSNSMIEAANKQLKYRFISSKNKRLFQPGSKVITKRLKTISYLLQNKQESWKTKK